uniref:Uncharacterized protein n=1 Tax=Timema cristinae TaxID=61476 RepID=A0A7R9CF99_TIMCR|nr:unnamed protein product [Timema cristinae]
MYYVRRPFKCLLELCLCTSSDTSLTRGATGGDVSPNYNLYSIMHLYATFGGATRKYGPEIFVFKTNPDFKQNQD